MRPDDDQTRMDPPDQASHPTDSLVTQLLNHSVVDASAWRMLSSEVQTQILASPDPKSLASKLTEERLLTAYQAERVGHGQSSELILGNYRVLDDLGSGGMG